MARNADFSTDLVHEDDGAWMSPEEAEALDSQALDGAADADGADASSASDEPDEGNGPQNAIDEDDGEPAPRRSRDKTPEEAKLAQSRRDKRRLARELEDEKARNAALEQRVNRIEQATIATHIRELENEVGSLNSALENARALKREAKRSGDVDEEDRIERAYEVLLERKAQSAAKLERVQQEVYQSTQQQQRQPRSVPRLAQEWAAENQTLMADRGAFAVVRALSSTLEAEGYEINDPDHYRELTERLRRALPEKFPKSRKPPIHSGGGGSAPRSQGGGRDQLAGVSQEALRAYRGTQTFKDNVSYALKAGVKREVAERQELQDYAKAFRSFSQ